MEVGDIDLKDKVVVVTGGGSGICLCFVKRAADLGAKVVIADLALTSEAEKLVNDNDSVIFQKTDVTKWDQLKALVTGPKEKFGSIPEVYVAGAGVFEPKFSNFWQDPEQDDRYAMTDINVDHPVKLTRVAMRALVGENKKGVVLPIASVGGLAGSYNCPLYIATKHAIVGFTKSMKFLEKYEGIKVVTICPGAVDTPLWTEEKRTRSNFESIEALRPDDVAKAMIDLVMEGKYKSGTVLEIMPNNGPKTRVVPEWNIDPPQGGSLTKTDPNSTEVPAPFKEMKEVMDRERGSGSKMNGTSSGQTGGHRKKISISQKTSGLWQAVEEDE
ncbi:uncharacterized protein LTR77_008624 [Saxophila tyrrhenica]|uniref:Alcohol dehydrogenase n=1 Tax=Saxophila tyrrhenica TaxID=1690608 RepID=A0AAV9P3H2_9PEZI|nr:hypothetical protein LTR77_008624 [Saxophila tyrrhenica]